MVAGLALTLVSSAAVAQSADYAAEGGVFFGGNFYDEQSELGNSFFDDQVVDSSVTFGIRAAFLWLGRLGLEVEGKFTPTSTLGDEAAGRDSRSASVIGWRGHAIYQLFPDSAFRPFIVAGIGGETLVINAPDSLSIDSPDTDFTSYWGAGAKFMFGDSGFGARADFRMMFAPGRTERATNYEVHGGIVWEFGGGTRTETVVVEKEVPVEKTVRVEVPVEPEIKDTDGDGLNDPDDQCPGQAEVFNSIDDTDGCPEIDSDADGLLGSRDRCPDAAEDMDGHQDDDGCPDNDNDGDGRPDRADNCPMEPETMNGYQDADGCPDEIPEKVKKFTGVIRGIRFARGKARIRRSSRRALNSAIAIMTEYPALRIEISGHTDDRGDADRNAALSQKRADAVKFYFVEKGIDPSRIETIGYGPNRPIADNGSRVGRAENRRIEFRLLPGPATVEAPPPASGQPAPATQPTTPPGGGQ